MEKIVLMHLLKKIYALGYKWTYTKRLPRALRVSKCSTDNVCIYNACLFTMYVYLLCYNAVE